MRTMAQLCDFCTKKFNCSHEQLQSFLQARKEDSTPSNSAEVDNFVNFSPAATITTCIIEPQAPSLNADINSSGVKDSRSSSDDAAEKCEEEEESVSKRLKNGPSPSRFTHTPSETCDPQMEHTPSERCDPQMEHMCPTCPNMVCVACLGILEDEFSRHLSQVITDHIKQVNPLGMETFSFSIHTPLSLAARRMGMETGVKMINHDTYDPEDALSEVNYVKEELRFRLGKWLGVSLSPWKHHWESSFTIVLNLSHHSCLRTCIGVKKLRPKFFPRPKKVRNRKKRRPAPITGLPLQKALGDLSADDLSKENFFLDPVSSSCGHQLELIAKSCFVAGRYNKYSRALPQTPWVIDGVRKAKTSVQELICPKICCIFHASDVRFSSSGREDVDVFMLGNGRPFLLELLNPMTVSVCDQSLKDLEMSINEATDLVAVRQLKVVSKESSILLKQGEEEKKKTYSALVWTEAETNQEQLQVLNESKNLVIQQHTPIRVLHRRTLAVREKLIYSMQAEQKDGHHFTLQLVTQAGTYIKEFVHGDFGRTRPNLGTLLGLDADILGLNVLDIQLEWPP